MRRFTHLGREFHPRYATHRWVIGISLAAAVWGGGLAALRGAGVLAIGWSAVATALAAFLAWAIGRELDPDHNLSAILAGGATAAAQPWLGAADLLGLAWFLGLARIMNRSTGLPPTASDLLLHYGAAALAGWLTGPLLPAVSGLGVVLAVEIHHRPRWQVVVGLLHVVTTVVLVLLAGWQSEAAISLLSAITSAAVAGGIAWAAGPRGEMLSSGDYNREPLKSSAVRAAIGLAALVVWLEWIRVHEMAIASWLPLIAVLLAVLLFRFVPVQTSLDDGSVSSKRGANGKRERLRD